VSNQFWFSFSRLDQLKALTALLIDGHHDEIISQILSLLDKAPCFYSLSFKGWSRSTIPMFENTSASVYKLDFADLPDVKYF
jgi:hypothetical protein